MTAHGFRSAFRDWASERTNFPREVCELALGHGVRDKTEAAYRRGDLLEKRRDLMAASAAFADVSDRAEVVPLPRRPMDSADAQWRYRQTRPSIRSPSWSRGGSVGYPYDCSAERERFRAELHAQRQIHYMLDFEFHQAQRGPKPSPPSFCEDLVGSDLAYWSKMASWRVDEAAALVFGKNPDRLNRKESHNIITIEVGSSCRNTVDYAKSLSVRNCMGN